MGLIRTTSLALALSFCFFGPLTSASQAFAVTGDFQQWLKTQEAASINRMLANVSPADAAPGVVVASPSKEAPNYYYHWIRDAALTMDTVVSLYASTSGAQHQALGDRISAYLRFSRQNQISQTITGLGEPKFNVDGTPFNGAWCRPQNDGPALRALTLMHFTNLLLQSGENNALVGELYDRNNPASVVKADLEFVANHWKDKGCDIWEEVMGEHFYTKLVQRRALIEGAALANRMGDPGAAKFYLDQSKALEPAIEAHWDASKNSFVPTINRIGGLDYKASNLDSQTVLGILHANAYSFTDPRVQSTMKVLRDQFASLYTINKSATIPGIGIGRYPEDKFGGSNFEHGNPWILITAAFADGSYRAAAQYAQQGNYDQAQAMMQAGDSYLQRVQYHANADGSLSEQFDRDSGFMMSARDLTWSHVEFIQAAWARKTALQELGKCAH